MSSQTIGLLFAVFTSLFWSVVAIILKYCVEFLDPASIAFIRMGVAAVFIILTFSVIKPKALLIFKKPPLLGILGGLCLGLHYTTFMKGLELTTAINTEIMIQIGPLLLVFVGIFFFKEKLMPIQWFGFALVLVGFILFYRDQAPHFLDQGQIYMNGNLWIFLSAFAWVIFSALQKKLSTNWNPQQINALNYVFAALSLVLFVDFYAITKVLTLKEFLILIFLGFYTFLSYGCYVEALKRAPIAYVGFIVSFNPLLTIVFVKMLEYFDISIIDFEEINKTGYIGASLVVLGMMITLTLGKRKAKNLLKKNKTL